MKLRAGLVVAGVLCACAIASAQTAPAPAKAAPAKPEPEEPDFAFISGSAYTQVKKSVQLIHQTGYGTRRVTDALGPRNDDAFLFFQRVEYGITDRWELDFVLPAVGSRTRRNGATVAREYGVADGIVGARYRLLDEEKFPVTLTMGPQILFPSGSAQKGTGLGGAGLAWDVAVSKDWGGPVFMYNTFNYRVILSAEDTTPGSTKKFALHGATWATALALRPMESPRKSGNKIDVHAFLEAGGSWQQSVEPGASTGTRAGELTWVVAPGVRYGFMTSRKSLLEIGVSAPIGLGPNGPKRGFIVQFQIERLFGGL